MGTKEIAQDQQVAKETIRLFWEALFQSKTKTIVATVGHSLHFFMNSVLIPLLIAYAIQDIIAGNFSTVNRYALAIAGVAVLSNLMLVVAVRAFNRSGADGAAYIYKKMFSNYLDKDYEFFSNNYVGSLGSYLVSTKNSFLQYQLLVGFDLPRVVVTIVASMVVICFHSFLLAGVILISMLANVGFTYAFARYRLKYRQAVGDAASNVAAVSGDALSHGTTVKSFASEPHERARLNRALKPWARAQLRSWELFIPMSLGRNFISMATLVLLLIVSAKLYQSGAIPIAIVLLLQLYVLRLMNTIIEVGALIKTYDQIMGDSHRAVATMLLPTHIKDSNQPVSIPEPVHQLSFEAVGYTYPDAQSDNAAVHNFSLVIEPGEKLGIVGYSGSGKTTLTKLLLRFMDVTDGSIRINGLDIRSLKQSDLRSFISYVPQEPLLFHRTIAENIAYATTAKDSQARVQRAAKLAYVDEFVADLPLGYQTMVGERGVKLSGGQRQRVAIARAILKDAPILVLDEATSALDSRSEQLIQKALWELMKDRTALVIAHRLSTIQKMDRIVVMDKGKIVELGTHDELLENKKGIYARLWSHQSGGYLVEEGADA